MAGNVWEWTDRFDSRGGGVLGGSFRSELGPRWPTEIDQRGGEWLQGEGHDDVGFRVALSC